MANSVVPSDPPYEAMATATEVTDGELSEIPSTVHCPHSERSRSEYGRSQPIVPADNNVRRPPVPMCLTRGFNPNAPREGVPTDHSTIPEARSSGAQNMVLNRTDHHYNQLNIANTVLVAGQDPTVTSLIEANAELRHGEQVAEIRSEAERLHGNRLQAVKAQAEQEHQRKVHEVVGALQERMQAEEARMWERAEVMEQTAQRRLRDQSEEYKTVLDSHLRQVAASKDQQMEQLKREYTMESAKKDVRITELESLIRMQSEQIANQQRTAEDLHLRMNQLLGSTPQQPLETGTMTMPPITKVQSTMNPNSKVFFPSEYQEGGETEPWTINAYGFPSRAAFSAAPSAFPALIPPASPELSTGWSQVTGLISPQDQIPPSPTEPAYTPVEAALGGGCGGGGNGPPDRDDGNGGNGDRSFGNPGGGGGGPPGLPPRGGGGDGDGGDGNGERRNNRRLGGGGGPPDGGDGDGGDDPDDDDDDNDDNEDERFIRRMRRIFGMAPTAPDPSSEQGKIKEADTIKLPAFPAAETYRNWRIKTREAVMSASTKPDKAFDWISETWKEDQTVDALREVVPFATLDAKLLSSLTNILTGDFARTIDTFKETEAAKGRYVRGRQVLLKMHQHFSTNIKHGATYALQDLFNVKLKGENLKVFLSNWDQVLAGIQKVPDENVLETLFLNQIKNSKNINHDLQEYFRAEDGSSTKSYDYLITAVRRFLERERLEVNRERIARNLGASSSATVPAVGDKVGYIPKGYCVKWNKTGNCSNDQCKFKHEKPPKRERSTSRTSERGRSPSRDDKGKGKKICKFWKQGRCDRGNQCKFKHEGKPGRPARAATPARSPSTDSKGNKRRNSRSPGKGRKDSKSPGRSKSPKPRSPRDKGKPDTPRASPAAVCLIASMLASVSEACVACPSIVFNPRVDITKVTAQGDLWPLNHQPRRYKKTYPCDYPFKFDQDDANDAALAAKMLSGAVKSELTGIHVGCDFKCDTDFGCDLCIPKGIVAAPAQSEELFDDALVEPIDWIADTGSAQDLLTDRNLPDRFGYYSDSPIRLITANGESSSSKQGKVEVPELSEIVKPYLVESSPAVLSVGTRCIDKGYDFIWKGSKGENPYFITPGGKRVELEVRDYVPYLCSGKGKVATPAVGEVEPLEDDEVPSQIERDDSLYSPSIAPGEDDDNDPFGINTDKPEDEVPEIIGDPFEEQEEKRAAERSAIESANRKVEPPAAVEGPLDPEFIRKRDRGISALKAEAKSVAHQMSHIPKNPYCEVCNKAKMLKPPGRAVGGSNQIESDRFGQHLTADFLVTMSEAEQGMDHDRVALVVKDVATDFRYVYPSARRTARDAVLALKHFTRQEDIVEVFYSDNAPELVSAAKILIWKHVIGRDYISTSNSVAERAVRSSLEGTRANLIQSGLHHSYWPYAARHWCLAHNVIEDEQDEGGSPWRKRFGENFPGPPLPFGCRIDYWTGPKKRPKNSLRFDPTTDPGVFLGYVIHPEFCWRKEFLVVSLKDALDSPIDAKLKVSRVINITKPEVD